MDIPKILTKNYPGSEWLLEGETYDGLTWMSNTPKPTEEELESLWLETQYHYELARAKEARQSVYQQESDPIFFKWQRGEATEQEWLDKIAEIDAANPYPDPL